MIPARNRQIAEALARGVSPEDVASLYDLGVAYVRGIAREHDVDLEAWDRERRQNAIHQAQAHWKPSIRAQGVLDMIGYDLGASVPKRPRCNDRDAAILEMIVLNDMTLDAVGKQFNLTRERVRQILYNHTALSPRDLRAYRTEMREARRLTDGRLAVQRLAASNPDMDVHRLADQSALTTAEVAEVLGVDETLRRKAPNTWTTGVGEAEVLEEIARVAALPGGTPLSGPFYDKHRATDALSAVRIIQRFSTWSNACQQAGVTPRKAAREVYGKKWTHTNLLDWTVLYLAEDGAAATYAKFEQWLRARKANGAPSGPTVRNELGKWSGILEQALARKADIEQGAEPTVVNVPTQR